MYSSDLIIKRIKDVLRNPANKIEGSLGADNAHAVGTELARLYDYIDWVHDMHYVDTATGEWLDKKADDYGLQRKGATKARGYVTFTGAPGTYIPTDFEVYSDTITFVTLENGTIPDSGVLRLECECVESGAAGNIPAGAITAHDRLSGLYSVQSEEFTGGVDVESDDDFRDRLLLYIRYPGMSGSAYHYMHWALEVSGVGKVQVYPLWDGPGTVKLSILDSNSRAATDELRDQVKNYIDPEDGMGEELAPIGAILTVSTAVEVPISLSGTLTVKQDSAREQIIETIKKDIDAYYRDISYSGDPTVIAPEDDHTVISYAKIIEIIMAVSGVLDAADIKINDQKDSIRLETEQIPIVGEVVMS